MNDTQDRWDFYFGRVDGKPASTFVNLSLGDRAPVFGYTDCLYVTVHMNAPRDDGLSSQDEFDTLAALEDRLAQRIAEQGGLFAGRVTHAGQRDFFAYFRDGGAAKQVLLAFRDAHPDYRMEIGARTDIDWQVYQSYLYPGPQALQQMRNRPLLMQLRDQGDALDRPRRINHFVLMPDRAAATAFATAAPEGGFTVDAVTETDDGSRQVLLQFSRQDAPRDIDAVTDLIISALEDAVGTYDGWGCDVLRPN